MTYSRQQLYALGEPFGDSCTRMEAGKRVYGGGGGSSQRDPTAEEKALWAAQAKWLNGTMDVSLPTLQTSMGNLGTLANESMDGTLAQRLRGIAGADAGQAMGAGIAAGNRNLARYGLDPHRFASDSNVTALGGAALKADAMNKATMGAEDLKWQRNAALAGLSSGQGNSAVSGMGSLAGQIGNNRIAGMNADSQSAQGVGMMGAYLANKMFADGGPVHEPGFASGGLTMFKAPSIQPMDTTGFGASSGGGGGGMAGQIMAPIVMSKAASMAGEAVKPLMEGATTGIKAAANMVGHGAQELGYQAMTPALKASGALANSGAAAPVSTATITPVAGAAGAEAGAGLAGAGAAGAAGAEAAGLAGAEAAGATAAGTTAATNFWNPIGWGAALYGVGKFADWWADGGPVPHEGLRRNFVPGGDVNGPGTETSDSIPARLSDGEFVLNAEAMKLPGVRKQVEKWNAQGLKRRQKDRKLADGGPAKDEYRGGLKVVKKGPPVDNFRGLTPEGRVPKHDGTYSGMYDNTTYVPDGRDLRQRRIDYMVERGRDPMQRPTTIRE